MGASNNFYIILYSQKIQVPSSKNSIIIYIALENVKEVKKTFSG